MTDTEISFPFPDPGEAGPAPEYFARGDDPLLPVRLPNGNAGLLVCGHAELRRFLTDPRFSRARAAAHGMTSRSTESLALNSVDPPDHTRRRRTVTAAFTLRRAEADRAWIREAAREHVTAMTALDGRAELIKDFTLPFSVAVICRIMGVPASDLPSFGPLVEVMMSTGGHSREVVRSAHTGMFAYFAELYDAEVAARGAVSGGPAATVLGDLVTAAEDEHVLTRDEMIHVAYGLLMAGYETTSNQIAICVQLLLAERTRWAGLRADPGGLRTAIEEMLRWTSLIATGGAPHAALEDTELGGRKIAEGQVLLPVFAAAGRDPRVFAEPHQLRLDRDDAAHLAFGHGRHACLGAPLARVELEESLGALLSLVPTLDLAVPDHELRWRQGTFIRGLTALPVRWDAGSPSRA